MLRFKDVIFKRHFRTVRKVAEESFNVEIEDS